MNKSFWRIIAVLGVSGLVSTSAYAQLGRRFPSEKKIVPDPVTGVPLTFLTSKPGGDSKIYQTHNQWTADGKWLVFRSRRVPGEAMAVNEETGDIVQITEGGYAGMLCVARNSMKLYFMREVGGARDDVANRQTKTDTAGTADAGAAMASGKSGSSDTNVGESSAPAGASKGNRGFRRSQSFHLMEVDLAKVFADSGAGKMKPVSNYERICGVIPAELNAGDLALDANEDVVYFHVRGGDTGKRLPPDTKIAETFGPRGMGAGPGGLRSMNLKTGEIKFVVDVPFQIGHVQANPFVPGEIVFCWETGGKAPQRTWTVMADGTGLRPLYPEASYEWVTHEAVISKDEVAIAILGHRKIGSSDGWGDCGTREHPTGLGIVNLRTRQMRIAGQTPSGSGLWHVGGSADGRWAVGDDFTRSIYLIDRHNDELRLLSTGHKVSAGDHPHPTFNADGTKIEIQSAMLSEDGRSMNICIIPVPRDWLARTYDNKMEQVLRGPASPDSTRPPEQTK